MRDSVLIAFCLIQYDDTKPTHNRNTITGQQREAIRPRLRDPEQKLRHWGAMKGKSSEAGIATTKTTLHGLFETGRMAHQFRHFLDAEGPPGPADGKDAVPLNAQVVTDLGTAG